MEIHNLSKYPLTIFCLLLVWYLSFFTPPQTQLDSVPFIDKWVHSAMYCGTCTIFWIEYTRRGGKLNTALLLLISVVSPILMSGIIELLQAFATNGNRCGDWLDFAANSIGVLLAALIGHYIVPLFIHSKKH
ncbi:MAG: hypothetical protein RR386_05220 [Bacteroidaceae bacterium]